MIKLNNRKKNLIYLNNHNNINNQIYDYYNDFIRIDRVLNLNYKA